MPLSFIAWSSQLTVIRTRHQSCSKNIPQQCRERRPGSDYPMKAQIRLCEASSSPKGDHREQNPKAIASPFRRIRALHGGVSGFARSFHLANQTAETRRK